MLNLALKMQSMVDSKNEEEKGMKRFEKLILTPENLESKCDELDRALHSVLTTQITNAVGINMGLMEKKFDGLDPEGRLEHEWSLRIALNSAVYNQRLRKGYVLLAEETYRRDEEDYDVIMRRKNTLVFLSIGTYLDIRYSEQLIEVFQDDAVNHGFAFSKPVVIIRSTLKFPRRKYEDDFFARFMQLPQRFSNRYRPVRSEFFAATEDGVGRRRQNGRTALMSACRRGRLKTARLLVAAGADVNAEDDDGVSALREALEHPRIVRLLLEAGADVNSRMSERAEPLLISAIRRGASCEVVRMLLSAGADIDAQNGTGETVLMVAAKRERAELAKILINAGADVNINRREYGYGGTALLCLAMQDFHQSARAEGHNLRLQIARWLITAGAELEAKDAPGATALHHVAEAGTSELLSLLIQAGANVENEMTRGSRPLEDAAWMGKVKNVRLLIEAGAEVKIRKGYSGSNVLHSVAERFADGAGSRVLRYKEIARLLIAAGAELNLQDSRGNTPLMRLLESYGEFKRNEGMSGFLAMLIEAGADLSLRNKKGETALDIAEAAGRGELAALLREAGALSGKGQEGVESHAQGSLAGIRFARDGLNAQDRDGRTALHRAVREGNAVAVCRLLVAGADPNVQDFNGNTPLLSLTFRAGGVDEEHRKKALTFSRLLIEANTDLELKNCDGNTAVMAAARYAYPELVRTLADAGADLKKKNKDGCNALDISADAVATVLSPDELKDAVTIVKLLRAAGVEVERCKERCEIHSMRVPAIYKAHEDIKESTDPTAVAAAVALVELVEEAGLQVIPILRPPSGKGNFNIHTIQYVQKKS